MTAYRFRVKFDPDPTSLWRDIVVGETRSVDEFQSAINRGVGLDQGHLWFVGSDQSYWNSDVKYARSGSIGDGTGGKLLGFDETKYDAGETTVGELVDRLGLDERDRLCYLYDFGDEWRFYGILKEIIDDATERPPEVVREKGDPIDQYAPSGPAAPGGSHKSSLPEPLDSLVPGTKVTAAELHALEDRGGVVHVIVILSIETARGRTVERFAIQLDDVGYLLELYPDGWEVVDEVEGDGQSEAELLAKLAELVRCYHAEIAELVGTLSDRPFDDETVEAMNVELDAELERLGVDHS